MMTEKTIEQRFGERIRDLRKKAGVSQEELADRAGVHRTYLGGIERGERNPSLKNIYAIARALKVPVSDLFKT
ncbi:DNA-binding protein [Dehalococcoides mccartyi CG4]|uniref:helix-turn-helix domain-containing protein n=1 Tax=Dehalococcoides mccartyi TaxID=61435 RepID=UPI0004E05FF4|nr:helix-turn-helix transcriptional regulator [Dehalococcoides mccartyi]AII58864.1 DNA-binding protein [Dehalococcoides mccartyi CG4]